MASSLFAGTLRIHVVDETGAPVWVRLEVRGAGEKAFYPQGALRDLTAGTHGIQPSYLGSFMVHGECQLEVPAGNYRVIAEHGTEYRREEKSIAVEAAGGSGVALRLRPWIRMWKQGWWSGDLHVHRLPADARKAVLAEDLNFCPVITQWPHRKNSRVDFGALWESGANPLVQIDSRHYVTVKNAEDERAGGAWLMLQMREPLTDLASATEWWPPALRFVQQARQQRTGQAVVPWIDNEKPFWWEAPVIMALATPDSFEILCNQLTEYGIEASEAWGRPRERSFAGREGWLAYILSLYYRYLNLGFRIPPSAGTASGVLPNPLGFNRTYVKFAGPFSVQKWFTALRDGPSFVTNGPMLFFHVRPNGTVARVSVEAHAAEPLDRIEIIANGEVVRWFPVSPGVDNFQADFNIDISGRSWIAARCFLREGDTIRMAHTSPVYLPGHWDCTSDAEYFVDWMNALIHQAQNNPKRYPSTNEQEQELAIYRQALAFYQQKVNQGCGAN